MEVSLCSRGDLDEVSSLQYGALEDAIIVPPPDAGPPLPKKMGRPRKITSAAAKPRRAAKHNPRPVAKDEGPGSPKNFQDYFNRNDPVLRLCIVIFTDITLVCLSWPHFPWDMEA